MQSRRWIGGAVAVAVGLGLLVALPRVAPPPPVQAVAPGPAPVDPADDRVRPTPQAPTGPVVLRFTVEPSLELALHALPVGGPMALPADLRDVLSRPGDEEGAGGLAARIAVSRPRPLVRRVFTAVGLRPGRLGAWLGPVWPRAAAVALVAETRWAEDEYLDAVGAATTQFEQRFGHPPDGRFRSGDERAFWDAIEPSAESDEVLVLADQLQQSDDPWVRGVATTVALDEAEDDESRLFDALASDDPRVRAYAAAGVSSPRRGRNPVPLSDQEAALLRAAAREFPEHAFEIGRFGLTAAISEQDLGEAAGWLEVLETGLARIDDERSSWGWALAHGLRGTLAGHGLAEVRTWEEGVIASAHGCHEDERGEVRGSAGWDGRWRWTFDRDDRFTRCLAKAPPSGPAPPPGQQVEVEITLSTRRPLAPPR